MSPPLHQSPKEEVQSTQTPGVDGSRSNHSIKSFISVNEHNDSKSQSNLSGASFTLSRMTTGNSCKSSTFVTSDVDYSGMPEGKSISSDAGKENILPDSVIFNMCTEDDVHKFTFPKYWTTNLQREKNCFFFIDKSEWTNLKKQQRGCTFPKHSIHTFLKGLKT